VRSAKQEALYKRLTSQMHLMFVDPCIIV